MDVINEYYEMIMEYYSDYKQGQEFVEWFTLEYKRKNATFWIKIDQVRHSKASH